MLKQEASALASAADTFGVPIPEAVKVAETFAATCRTVLGTVEAEVGPEPLAPTATERQVLDWIGRQLDAARHDDRLAEARGLVKRADQCVLDTWAAAAPGLLTAFTGPFDAAAAEVVRALDGRDQYQLGLPGGDTYQAVQAATRRVATLEKVHETLTGTGGWDGGLDPNVLRTVRVLSVPTREHYANYLRARTHGLTRMSPEWLAVMLGAGCTLRWATLAEITDEWQRTPVDRTTRPAAVA